MDFIADPPALLQCPKKSQLKFKKYSAVSQTPVRKWPGRPAAFDRRHPGGSSDSRTVRERGRIEHFDFGLAL